MVKGRMHPAADRINAEDDRYEEAADGAISQPTPHWDPECIAKARAGNAPGTLDVTR